MAAVPAHPRLSHMVLRAQQLDAPDLGCLLAALLSERDLFRTGASGSEQRSAELALRIKAVLGQGGRGWSVAAAGAAPLCDCQVTKHLALKVVTVSAV